MTAPLLDVAGLVKHYPVHGGLFRTRVGTVKAVDGISFRIDAGETLGLVGESGCGKSTAARAVLQLIRPTEGSVRLDGQEIAGLGRRAMQPHRRKAQLIFQDAYAALNSRMTAAEIVGEPMRNFRLAVGEARAARVRDLFVRVGLPANALVKYPHEFSGGQRQRIGIARALAVQPRLMVCDEPVSALDVSVQAQIVNLLMDLQEELGLSYLFVAHDLAVVRHISHRVAVMYLGRIVEMAPVRMLFDTPQHPYTRGLLAAVPVPRARARRKRELIAGDVPSPMRPPSGCRFHTRCPQATPQCAAVEPPMRELAPGHFAACHLLAGPGIGVR